MNVVMEARDTLVTQLYSLDPGSEEMLRHVQAIKIMSDIDRDDRKLDFDVEKEETRKLERSNDLVYSDLDRQIKWFEVGIKLMDVIFNPGERLIGRILNNKVRIKRDIMGYQFEETGVIGSHTFNNAQKDKYD
jgi:hypothetical protein